MTVARSVVCDAGGLLAVSGELAAAFVPEAEFLALDWSSITVARFLAARYDGDPVAIEARTAVVQMSVSEWFPVRELARHVVARAGLDEVDVFDSWSALLLAELLASPLYTASDEVASPTVEILRPW